MAARLGVGLVAGLGIALLSWGAWAGEPKEPERGNPMLFDRLDKNHDGVITADEIPPAIPEPLKAWLKKADKNSDKKLTRDEFNEALKAGPPPIPGLGRERPRRGPEAAPPKPPPRPPVGPRRPQLPTAGPGAERGRIPDPKALFEMMDKNHDGSLSLEEFTAGMKEAHQRMAERFRTASIERPRQPGPGPAPGMGPGPGPGPGMGPGFGMGPGSGMGPGFGMGPGGMGPRGMGQLPGMGPGVGPQRGMGQGPGMAWGYGMGRHQMGGPPGTGWWRSPMGPPGPRHMPQACPCPWCRFGPPPRYRAEFGHGPQPRSGGPGEEYLRKLVARLVREEVEKILQEKAGKEHHPSAGPIHPEPPHRDVKPDAKK